MQILHQCLGSPLCFNIAFKVKVSGKFCGLIQKAPLAAIQLLILSKGFYIAFGAYIGYPSSRLSDTLMSIPPDRLLVETDCPFLPPQTHRGKRNEPSYLPGTAGIMALARREAFDTIAEITSNNARRLFKF